MKDIRLFIRYVWAVLMLFALQLQVVSARITLPKGSQAKVTFKIERKVITRETAQNYINNHTPVPLKVSLIFEGKWWVDYIQNGTKGNFGASNLAFGIAQGDGPTAPLALTDQLAWIYGKSGCTSSDGIDLTAPSQDLNPIINSTWYTGAVCPRPFSYAKDFTGSNIFNSTVSKITPIEENGNIVGYEVDLFNLYFGLKSDFLNNPNLYVRAIDCNAAGDAIESTDDEHGVLKPNGATTNATTICNIYDSENEPIVWPGGPTSGNADWTLSGSPKYGGNGKIETDYYGGVIPGGIFIEQVPELTQFEP